MKRNVNKLLIVNSAGQKKDRPGWARPVEGVAGAPRYFFLAFFAGAGWMFTATPAV
jgi:hypothetical protein